MFYHGNTEAPNLDSSFQCISGNIQILNIVMAKTIKPAKLTDKEAIEQWMAALDHPMKKEVEALRKIIKSASALLNERIKWNAPSYYYKEDIVTFGPYRDGKILLVFHHPFIVKIKSPLLEGDYKDRRLAYFESMKAIKDNKEEITRIITEIIALLEAK